MNRRGFILGLFAAALPTSLFAKGGRSGGSRSSGGSRPSYSGSKHTTSHGGSYSGGSGSSHRGGTYSNPRSGDQYGKHKQ